MKQKFIDAYDNAITNAPPGADAQLVAGVNVLNRGEFDLAAQNFEKMAKTLREADNEKGENA